MFDRDEQEISQIIENGLEAILSGRATLEGVVAQHPEQAEVIRPELEGALWLVSQRQEVEARPGFVSASRKRVLERIKAEAHSNGAKHSLFGIAWPPRFAFQWAVGAAIILILMIGTGGVVTVSQSTLPGDGLYAVKQISEQVSYTVTLGEVQRVQLSAQFAERRITEVETLMARGNYPEAASALNLYERQVNQTVELLNNISDSLPKEKLGAAVAFKDDLTQNADRLANLLDTAPAFVRTDLQDAQNITSLGAALTDELIGDIPPVDVTGTPTPTTTQIMLETPTPYRTDTPVPSQEPTEPEVDLEGLPKDAETPEPGPTETVSPDDPTNTLTPQEIMTRTARPSKTPKPLPPAAKPGTTDKEDKGKDPPGKKK